jgi:hypothetical protein
MGNAADLCHISPQFDLSGARFWSVGPEINALDGSKSILDRVCRLRARRAHRVVLRSSWRSAGLFAVPNADLRLGVLRHDFYHWICLRVLWAGRHAPGATISDCCLRATDCTCECPSRGLVGYCGLLPRRLAGLTFVLVAAAPALVSNSGLSILLPPALVLACEARLCRGREELCQFLALCKGVPCRGAGLRRLAPCRSLRFTLNLGRN